MCEALRDLMRDEIEEERAKVRAEARKKDRQNAINLYNNGVRVEVIASSLNLSAEEVEEWVGLRPAKE